MKKRGPESLYWVGVSCAIVVGLVLMTYALAGA